MLVDGLIPGVGHLVAAGRRGEPVPLAPLVGHTPLGKEDDHITRHVLYAVRRHAQPTLEGHQQGPYTTLNPPLSHIKLSMQLKHRVQMYYCNQAKSAAALQHKTMGQYTDDRHVTKLGITKCLCSDSVACEQTITA